MRVKQAHIAKVAHLAHCRTQLNFNYIQPKSSGFLGQRTQIGPRDAPEDFAFGAVHRVITGHARAGVPGLYLHKDEDFPVPGDQINFLPPVLRVAPIPGYDDKAFLAREIIGR